MKRQSIGCAKAIIVVDIVYQSGWQLQRAIVVQTLCRSQTGKSRDHVSYTTPKPFTAILLLMCIILRSTGLQTAAFN